MCVIATPRRSDLKVELFESSYKYIPEAAVLAALRQFSLKQPAASLCRLDFLKQSLVKPRPQLCSSAGPSSLSSIHVLGLSTKSGSSEQALQRAPENAGLNSSDRKVKKEREIKTVPSHNRYIKCIPAMCPRFPSWPFKGAPWHTAVFTAPEHTRAKFPVAFALLDASPLPEVHKNGSCWKRGFPPLS